MANVCHRPVHKCTLPLHKNRASDSLQQSRAHAGMGNATVVRTNQPTHPEKDMLYAFEHQQIEQILPHQATGEPTDEQLMGRIKAQEDSALAHLYRRHFALLRTVISRVLNNDHDVDDLVQEVFLEVWRQAEHYSEEKGKALGWLVTLARRRAIDRVRKKQAYYRAQER